MPLAAALRGAAAVLDLSLGVLLKPPPPRIARTCRLPAPPPPLTRDSGTTAPLAKRHGEGRESSQLCDDSVHVVIG
jgi:hypothetical protein